VPEKKQKEEKKALRKRGAFLIKSWELKNKDLTTYFK
jgi:hypothetical protein